MKLYARRGFEWAEDGLVGLWCPVLTGATGLYALDSSGFANHGTLTGYANEGQPWVGNTAGTAINFDGANDLVDVPNTNGLVQSSYTISFWIRRNGNSVNWITKGSGQSDDIEVYQQTASNIVIAHNRGNGGQLTAMGFPIIPNLTLTHVVISYDLRRATAGTLFSRWQAWYNGIPQLGTPIAANAEAPLSTNTRWQISSSEHAAFTTGKFFNGQMSEVAIWNRAFLPGEAIQASAAGPGGMWQDRPRRSRVYFSSAGFRAYWHRRQSQLIGGGV